MSVIKRFFFYAVSLISLGMFAGGIGNILRIVTDLLVKTSTTQIGQESFSAQSFSLGLALIIIGGGLWFFFWRYIQKNVKGNTEETGSAIRAWYLNVVLLISLSIAITAATELISWLVGNRQRIDFSAQMLANIIVAAVIWYYHHSLQENEGQPSPAARTLRRWYIYIFSAWGLIFTAVGLVQLINHAILWLPVWGTSVQSGPFFGQSFGFFVGFILVGAFVWWLHWFKLAKGDISSTLRQVYLYLLTILGSVIAGLTGLIFTLYSLLVYVFGGVPDASGTYFQFFGWTVPLMLVAAGIWTFHRQVAQDESAQMPELKSSARRVYSYLMSLVGLGGLVAGLVVLIGLLLRLLASTLSSSSSVSTGNGYWQSFLSLTLSLLIVGAPMWFYYWNKIIKMVEKSGVDERRAMTRRVYLYFILAATIVASATGLSNVIYQVLNGIFQGKFGIDVFRQSIWGLQSLLVALPFLFYHLKILRTDQKLGAEVIATKKKAITILAAENTVDLLIPKIEQRLGIKPRLWHYPAQPGETTPVLSDTEVEKAINDIEAASGNKLMLVFTAKGLQIFSYEDK